MLVVFVAIVASEVLPVVCNAAVAAPDGSGNVASEAITTDKEPVEIVWPIAVGNWADTLLISVAIDVNVVLPAVCNTDVAAPEGNGNVASEANTVDKDAADSLAPKEAGSLLEIAVNRLISVCWFAAVAWLSSPGTKLPITGAAIAPPCVMLNQEVDTNVGGTVEVSNTRYSEIISPATYAPAVAIAV